MNVNSTNEAEVARLIHQRYYGRGLLALDDPDTLRFLSVDQFVRPIRETVRIFSAQRSVYMYELSYEGLLGGDNRNIPGIVLYIYFKTR